MVELRFELWQSGSRSLALNHLTILHLLRWCFQEEVGFSTLTPPSRIPPSRIKQESDGNSRIFCQVTLSHQVSGAAALSQLLSPLCREPAEHCSAGPHCPGTHRQEGTWSPGPSSSEQSRGGWTGQPQNWQQLGRPQRGAGW